MAKAIVETGKSALPSTNINEQFGAHAGAGMEHVTANDLLVPRLVILQSLSPQLNKKKAEHIEGAEIGTIADVGTGDIFKDGVAFLPVHYRKDFIEWRGTKPGGGLVKVHTDPAVIDSCVRNDKNQMVNKEGNTIAETAQFFGINLTADRRRCFVPMASTQLKKARRWMTLATGERLKRADGSDFIAPLFYRTYHLTSAMESNESGEWGGWKIERGKSLPEFAEEFKIDVNLLISEAVKFRDSLVKGEVQADTAGMQGVEQTDSEVM